MSAETTQDITIAILPFKNVVGEGQHDPLFKALTEDVILNLSLFTGISVVSHFTTQHIDADVSDDKLNQIGAEYIVYGSYFLVKDQVKISLQIIRNVDKRVVFATKLIKNKEAVFELQDDIIQQIVSSIQQQIDYDLLSYSYKKKDVNLVAYENYLLGMDKLKKGTLDSDLEARRLFEAALKIDPNYSRAYTGISLSFFNEWSCRLWDRWEVSKNGAQKYAMKALELDENDYISLSVLGRTYIYSENFTKAEHLFRKSLRMNPNDANNLMQVAFGLMYLGYPEESIELYKKACYLNPYHPEYYNAYGFNFYFEIGDYKEAVRLGEKVNWDSAWIDFPFYLGATYFNLGNREKAEQLWFSYLEQFKATIKNSGSDTAKDALTWQINVNPYQFETKLKAFREYIADKIAYLPTKELKASKAHGLKGSFQKKSDLWQIEYDGKGIVVKDAKGILDLVKLIDSPNTEFHCTELMGTGLTESQGVEVIDNKAKKQYQDRILQLQDDIRDSEDLQDYDKAELLQKEYDDLIEHLSSVLGLRGKVREKGTVFEKARSAVTWRVRNTIQKIEKEHPTLGKHLKSSIKTGVNCAYKPELEVQWTINF